MAPKKTRRLFSLERQMDTPSLAGAGATFLARCWRCCQRQPRVETLFLQGWAAPRCSWALIREMILVCCWGGSLGQPQGAAGSPQPILVASGLRGLQTWFAPGCPAAKRRESQGCQNNRFILPLLLGLNDPRRGSAHLTL